MILPIQRPDSAADHPQRPTTSSRIGLIASTRDNLIHCDLVGALGAIGILISLTLLADAYEVIE